MRVPLFYNRNRAERTWTGRGIMAAAALLVVLASASLVPASNPWTYLVRSSSGMTFFEVYVLYSLPRDVVFWVQHEVEVMDFARRALVRQGKIRDLPIVVANVYDARKPGWVALIPNCTASEGQGSYGQLIGRCYVVVYGGALSPGRRNGHQNLLALTASLADLSSGRAEIEFDDLDAVRTARAAEIASFNGIVHHFDPIWSLDGTQLLYTVWESGEVRFELLEASSRNVTRLEPVEGYVAVRPIWSDDSRFIAYASLQTIKVFDTQTRTTRTFRRKTPSSEMRTLILFEGSRLRFVFHDMSTGTEVFDYDAVRENLQQLEYVPSGPGWPEWFQRAERYGLALDRHASLMPVRSPTGRYAAIFTFVDGQRRIVVKALQ